MSIFSTQKTKLEKVEKELKIKFFSMYKNAKEMIENQGAKVEDRDKNLLMQVSQICEEKELSKVG